MNQTQLQPSPFFELLNRYEAQERQSRYQPGNEERTFIDWNGVVLPHDHGDPDAEYHAVRNACGAFDVSPLRKLKFSGPEAADLLDRTLTRPVSGLQPGRGTYVVFCEDAGHLKDDALLHRLAEDAFLLMPSDMDHQPWFSEHQQRLGLSGVTMQDLSDRTVGLALQGPTSASLLKSIGFADVAHLEPFAMRTVSLRCGPVQVARMGFTGGLGYECWMSPETGTGFAELLASARQAGEISFLGYGLTALEACRLECGHIVAGWDCSTAIEPQPGFERSPFELGLDWLVNLEAHDFPGRDALREQQASGVPSCLRSAVIQQRMALDDGLELLDAPDGRRIGRLNNSAWSPGVNATIGNASIERADAATTRAWLRINDATVEVALCKPPLRRFRGLRTLPAPLV